MVAALAALALTLPTTGVAVQHGATTKLYRLDGALVRTLPHWRIVTPAGSPVGTVWLRDGVRRFWRLEGGTLARTGAPRLHVVGGCFTTAPTVRICGYPYGRGRSRIVVAGRVVHGSARPHGHWLLGDPSPALGGRLLAQWSGECEAPVAYIGDLGGLVPIVAGDVDSYALGWAGRRAVVTFPVPVCGRGKPPYGVYVVRRLVVPLRRGDVAQLWR